MIAAPEADIELGGVVVRICAASTAMGIMEADIFHAANAHAHMTSVPREQDVNTLQRWCAAHIVSVEGEDWDAMSTTQRRYWVDCELDWPELTRVREAIVELSSMPKAVVDDVREFWRIAASGGCECPVCKGRFESTPERREQWCLYATVDESVERIVSATASMQDAPALDAPWWFYQIQQARALGRAQAQVERNKKNARKTNTRGKLKSRGIL